MHTCSTAAANAAQAKVA